MAARYLLVWYMLALKSSASHYQPSIIVQLPLSRDSA